MKLYLNRKELKRVKNNIFQPFQIESEAIHSSSILGDFLLFEYLDGEYFCFTKDLILSPTSNTKYIQSLISNMKLPKNLIIYAVIKNYALYIYDAMCFHTLQHLAFNELLLLSYNINIDLLPILNDTNEAPQIICKEKNSFNDMAYEDNIFLLS